MPKALPVRCLQLVQWQTAWISGSPETVTEVAPQAQSAVLGMGYNVQRSAFIWRAAKAKQWRRSVTRQINHVELNRRARRLIVAFVEP